MLKGHKGGIGGRVLKDKNLVKSPFYDAGTGFKRLKNIGFKGGAAATGRGFLNYFSRNFAEGFQELAQEGISHGTKDYYTTI